MKRKVHFNSSNNRKKKKIPNDHCIYNDPKDCIQCKAIYKNLKSCELICLLRIDSSIIKSIAEFATGQIDAGNYSSCNGSITWTYSQQNDYEYRRSNFFICCKCNNQFICLECYKCGNFWFSIRNIIQICKQCIDTDFIIKENEKLEQLCVECILNCINCNNFICNQHLHKICNKCDGYLCNVNCCHEHNIVC